MDRYGSIMAHRALLFSLLVLAGLTMGCGKETEFCDSNGCYVCDGISCRTLSPPETCVINADCGRDELVCRDGMCVPDDRTCGELGCNCTLTGACDDGYVCTGGECRPEDEVCRFDHACGTGRVCVDGRCLDRCGGEVECDDGLTCVSGACVPDTTPCAQDVDCGDGLVCLDGGCVAGCSSDGQCAASEFCDRGHCRYDDRFTPFCVMDGDCQPGHLCVDGLCRTPCTTDVSCLAFDAQFRFCRQGFCQTFDEISSDCHTSVDCEAGEVCVNGSCN
jgi:hypothetical protein